MSEFIVAGLLISPFVKYALVTLVIFLPIRLALARVGFQRWVWHPLLAEAGLYVCLLAVLNIFV
jgi:hypothetical protein